MGVIRGSIISVMSARGPAVSRPTRWVLLPFIRKDRRRRVLQLLNLAFKKKKEKKKTQMKTYNMYETITAGYWKFVSQPKRVKFSFRASRENLSSGSQWGHFWIASGGQRWWDGEGDVNEDTDAKIWGCYCRESSVKYEKELKDRLLKSMVGAPWCM